jgi:hypothetical protein
MVRPFRDMDQQNGGVADQCPPPSSSTKRPPARTHARTHARARAHAHARARARGHTHARVHACTPHLNPALHSNPT